MAFNPFTFFKGNPKVQELIGNNEPISKLLMEDAFVSEFKKNQNQPLQKYMTYQRYEQLITFITTIDTTAPNDKDRNYKFPFAAAEILGVNNAHSMRHLLEETSFVEEEIEEEVDVEMEVNSQSSDRSYSSIKSDRSSPERDYQEDDKENYELRQENDKHLTEMTFPEDISADDFPDVKGKRTVMVKQIIKKKVKRGYEPLLCQLLDYFQNKEVIHILDGYVCRALDNILANGFERMVEVIRKYGRINAVKKMFTHLESQSVQDFLLSFISRLAQGGEKTLIGEEISFTEFIQKVCATSVDKWPSSVAILQQKVYILGLFALILQRLCQKLNALTMEGDAQENRQMLKSAITVLDDIMKPDFIRTQISIINDLMSKSKAVYPYPKITVQYLTNFKILLKIYLKLKELDLTDFPSLYQDIASTVVQKCEDSFDSFIEMGFRYAAEEQGLTDSTLGAGKPHHPLRCKIEVLQIVGMLLKDNLYFARKTLAELPGVENVPQLFENHPNSSIYHNGLLGLLLPFVSSQNDAITLDLFFSKRVLLRKVHNLIKEDLDIRYSQQKRRRKCYMAHVHQLCVSIDQLQDEESQQLLEFKQSKDIDYAAEQWQFIHEYLKEEEKGIVMKALGGHTKQKNKKSIISFAKEESLIIFKQFLQGDKFNNLDDFENYEPGASDSEEEDEKPHIYQSEGFEPTSDTVIPRPFDNAQDDAKYFSDEPL